MKQHKPSHDDDSTAAIIFQTLVPPSRINVCDQLNITTDHLIRVNRQSWLIVNKDMTFFYDAVT